MERAAVNRDFDFSHLGMNEVMGIIENLLDHLPAQALMKIRDLAETKRLEKLDEAENAVIAEMRQKLEELGVTYDLVVRRKRKRDNGSVLQAKYRGPNGEQWSGRGFAPLWLRTLEAEGHDREEYLIKETN